MRNLTKLTPLLALSFLFCGCPRRPADYSRPAMPVPDSWPDKSQTPTTAPGSTAAAELKWQEFFTDQRLQSVISLALANNRDLRAAALNIERAQALYRIQRAQLYPTISASANAEGYRIPETASGSDNSTVAQITVGLGAVAWELDLFGRIRSLRTAALEQFFATEQARSAVQISLVGAVANTYLVLAADRENLRIARETLEAQQASYDLVLRSRDLGIASDLDLQQARTQVEAARADIARYSGQIAVDQNALNLLVGAPVPPTMLADALGSVGEMKDVAVGLPSDVLLRRPDILGAEHQLLAFHANIGAARAAFFPRISLTAAAGVVSNDLTNLFKPAAGTWNVAPQAILPIFDYGARSANFRIAEVDRDMAVAEYERTIQGAFREVSDALALRTTLVSQQDALEALVNALEETYRLSQARYQGGIDSYLNVLVAQRSLYAAQQQMVDIRLARVSNLVTLYRALGGGA